METSTPRTMITFSQHGTRFTFRVVGIVIHDERVLFQRSDEPEQFYFLPGGRAEMGEMAEETLKREMREELGTEIHIERLLYVVENLFTHEDESHHEIGFYFLMTLLEAPRLHTQGEQFLWKGEEEHLQWGWLPIAQLPGLPIYPQFLRTALQKLPDHTLHIIETS